MMPHDPLVHVERIELGGVSCLTVRPSFLRDNEKAATIIYMHGGGFVIGSAHGFYKFAEKLALLTESVVISVDYRLAATHPYPASIEDIHKVASALPEHASKLSLDLDRLAVAGDSAGGNLAVRLALDLSSRGTKLSGAVFIVPWLQIVNRHLPSYQIYAENFVTMLNWCQLKYCGQNVTQSIERAITCNKHVPDIFLEKHRHRFDLSLLDPSIRPADHSRAVFPDCNSTNLEIDHTEDAYVAMSKLAQDSRAWPFLVDDAELSTLRATKVFVQACEFDALRDENLLFHHRLKNLGIDSTLSYLHNATHDETIMVEGRVFPPTVASRKGLADIVKFLRKVLHG